MTLKKLVVCNRRAGQSFDAIKCQHRNTKKGRWSDPRNLLMAQDSLPVPIANVMSVSNDANTNFSIAS